MFWWVVRNFVLVCWLSVVGVGVFDFEVSCDSWFMGIFVAVFESSLQALRTETMVDGLPCAASFIACGAHITLLSYDL